MLTVTQGGVVWNPIYHIWNYLCTNRITVMTFYQPFSYSIIILSIQPCTHMLIFAVSVLDLADFSVIP